MSSLYWRMIPFLIFVVLTVFFLRGLSLDPHDLPLAQLNKPLPRFELPVLGAEHASMTSGAFRGHVTLLNVWASWCEACTEEQVFLLQLAREGVNIYGLNYKDKPKAARAWLLTWGNPYKMVGADVAGKVAIDLGVYGAPETFLIDKAGYVRYRHVGVLTKDIWARDFVERIKQLERG